ncbi:hypothetical protein G4B88_022540 [Cannabis sativa]|uniref:MYB-CC type transcription factor LHEQLE-containing domain-containing protein n=1 Tax=Cannabis sativa TaxID=3483 RepID=A0A7J6HVW3_CANSA|nr:hypothetical protein G4B88_022540 [Cannabis sativa]
MYNGFHSCMLHRDLFIRGTEKSRFLPLELSGLYQQKAAPSTDICVHGRHLDSGVNTMDPVNGGNSLNNPSLASKQRLRWTHELHERFVDAVAQLGGPDRKKADKKEPGDTLSNMEGSSGMQITEALKLQMEVQKRLHEQLEVQRQLQLRIEAQGKYLKKIIEEQQRLSGVLSDGPGVGDNGPESDKTEPATPAPTSETPLELLDKTVKEHTPAKSLSVDESLSSHQEPSTPDSGCHDGSPAESPEGERLVKKQRVSMGGAFANPDLVLTHQILESSLNSSYQQPQSAFLAGEQFESSRNTVGNSDQLENVTAGNL